MGIGLSPENILSFPEHSSFQPNDFSASHFRVLVL